MECTEFPGEAKAFVIGLCLLAACATVRPVAAVDAVWTGTAASANWVDLENWTDAQGAPLAVAPTNASDSAVLNVPASGSQTIWFPAVTPLSIGTISGNCYHTLRTSNAGSNGVRGYQLNLGDVSGFEGAWNPGRTGAVLAFTGETNKVRMSELNVSLRPTVKVPSGTKVTLGAVSSGGALVKTGAGTLAIETPRVGDSQIIYHNEGTVELVGRGRDNSSLPGDPLFWVDAAKADSLELVHDDATGRDLVSRWYDRRHGDDVHEKSATPINHAQLAKPWVSSWTLNGLPVVDFGAFGGGSGSPATDPDTYGPAASLQYSLGANVKEIFIVWMDTCEENYTDAFFIGQTGAYNFHRGFGATGMGSLFAAEAHDNVEKGTLVLDGATATASSKPTLGKFHILDAAIKGEGLQPNTFCNDRTTVRYGGARIAEAIFYAEQLTTAERGLVTRYLQEKWFNKPDVNVLKLKNDACAVSVPTGRVATAREVVIDGAKLRKEGAGTLMVGRFQKEDPVIDVAGGAVALDGSLETIDDTAPAGDPVFWADATQMDSLVIETEGGTNFISRWNDCRPDKTQCYALADNASNKVGRKPYVSADTCNGLPVVDFGEYNVDSAYMTINCGAILEAFEVVRIPRNGYLGPNIFGCSGQALLRECTTSLISTWAAYLAPSAGLWTMDGLFVDPWQSFTVANDRYYVASFSSEENAGATYLGTDRNILNNGVVECGDTRLGEFIAYNRRLTDEERRQTIAYLMKKWKDEGTLFTKPAGRIAKMNFTSENAHPTVVADVDTDIDALVFNGQEEFVKTGAGKLTVEKPIPALNGTISVAGDMEVKGAIDYLQDAAFHVDASRPETIAYRAGQESDGRIDKWFDCRFNGRYAQTPLLSPGVDYGGLTNAVLGMSDGTRGLAAGLPYVDFLQAFAGNTSTNIASGMFWRSASGSAWKPSDVREYHVVYLIEKGASAKNGTPIGGEGGPAVHTLVPSGNSRGGYWGTCTRAGAGAKMTDGSAWFTSNGFLPNDADAEGVFHVTTIMTTDSVSAYSFDIDRGACGRGGVKLCEAIVFTGATNDVARAEAIHRHLLKKWKGIGEGATLPVKLGARVEIAAGGSLKLSSEMPFSLARVSGAGTLDVERLTDVARLDVSVDAAGTVSLFQVSGEVTFADQVTVSLSVDGAAALRTGSQPFFSADRLVNVPANLKGWTIRVPDSVRYQVCGRVEGATLKLEFLPRGMMLIVR